MTAFILHFPSSAPEEKKFARHTSFRRRQLDRIEVRLHELLSAKILSGENQDVEILFMDVAAIRAAAKVKLQVEMESLKPGTNCS